MYVLQCLAPRQRDMLTNDQGATEALRGTLNYSIDKHIGRTDPAVLEQERQTIEKGKAEIDPRYMEKFKGMMAGEARGGGVNRKPVGGGAGGGVGSGPTGTAVDRHRASELP